MKKELVAMALIALLPACSCIRKKDKTTKAPKKEMSSKKAKDTKGAKTHMDMRSRY